MLKFRQSGVGARRSRDIHMSLLQGLLGVSIGSWAKPHVPTGMSRYIVAVGTIVASLVFRYGLRESLGLRVPYLQFYPAIIVAAWYGGLGPGLLTIAVSALTAMYFLLPPEGFAVNDPWDQLSLGIFVATGFVIAWLNQYGTRIDHDPMPRKGEIADFLDEDAFVYRASGTDQHGRSGMKCGSR